MNETLTRVVDPVVVAACGVRLGRLRTTMEKARVDALLISAEPDILYLTDFVGHDSLLLVSGDTARIVSDPRYDEFLDPWREVPGIHVVMGTRHRLPQTIKSICDDEDIQRIGIQAEYVTLAQRSVFAEAFTDLALVETTGLVGGLRMRKDDVEIARIEAALRIQQDALDATLPTLKLGMPELEFWGRLDFEMKRRGAPRPSFDAIIGTGANSSIIHYATADAPIQEGTLLVDWGAVWNGYCSDLTRTFGIGQMPEKIREIYQIVLDAQLAAIDACAPGKTGAEIDAVARRVITDAGYGEYFGHGLGHGLGIEVHEDPYFNDLATNDVMEPGMVMTVEPGIYLPGVGGVRIEDDILITATGCRVLSDYPKGLEHATVEPAGSAGRARA